MKTDTFIQKYLFTIVANNNNSFKRYTFCGYTHIVIVCKVIMVIWGHCCVSGYFESSFVVSDSTKQRLLIPNVVFRERFLSTFCKAPSKSIQMVYIAEYSKVYMFF